MGDLRFSPFYERIARSDDPAAELAQMRDEEVIAALAGASLGRDPYVANVLATEAINRCLRAAAVTGALVEGVCGVDERGVATLANPAAARLLARDERELVGADIHELLHGAHAGTGTCPLEDALRDARARERDDAFRTADGREVPVRWRVAPILHEGERRGAVLTFADLTDRRRAQTATSLLAAIVQSAEEAIYGKSLEGTILSWNPAAERLYGYRADEIVGRSVRVLEPPDRIGEAEALLARVRRGERVERSLTRRRRRDGAVIDVVVTVSPIRDESGALVGASAVASRPDSARALADAIPGIVASADERGGLVHLSPRWSATTGRDADACLGWGWLDAVHAEDRAPLVDRWTEAIAELKPMEAHARLSRAEDGAWRWHLIRFVPWLGDGAARRWVGVMIDVDDGMRAVEAERATRADAEGALRAVYASMDALEASKERFASLVEASSQIVWFADPQGRAVVSPQWEAFTGVAAHPGAWLEAIHPDDRGCVLEAWQRAVANGTPYFVTARVRSAQGEYRVFAMRAIPVRGPGGAIREWLGTLTDVNEAAEAEARLETRVRERTRALESANRELESFSSAVSHDLRAPLRGIYAYADVLEERAARLDDEGRDALARLKADARRMGVIIDDLIALSRAQKEEIRRQPVDLAPLAREIVERLRAAEPGRKVQVAIAPTIPAEADPRAMRLLLENLIGNAWKFTREAPEARIVVDSAEEPEGRVYRVADNGAGFDMARAARLFRPFQRLHGGRYEGTGLGLSTVARLVERHGGRIWAQAMPEKGATFFFTLGGP